MRKKMYSAIVAVVTIMASLTWANPAFAAPGYTSGTINATGGGGVVATGYTSGWAKGTINLEVILYNNGKTKNDVKDTCYSATSCHNNPTPIVSCGCPGTWELAVYADNGKEYNSFHKTIVASLVNGKLVLKEIV